MPRNLIIVSYFFSQNGVNELNTALPNADIYVSEKDDNIDASGMLNPGVGNLDLRIK